MKKIDKNHEKLIQNSEKMLKITVIIDFKYEKNC